MQDYYAARAPEYDRIYSKPERQADLRQIEQWLPTVFAGRSVLEIACGTGYWTQFIAPVASRVLAIDASVETMRIARDRVPADTVEFVRGDAYDLPGVDVPFESAFAGFWISHVPRSRVREFLTGLHRALAPGATVVLLDNRYVEGNSTPIERQDVEGNTYQLRKLDDGTTHRVLKNYPSPHELRAATKGLARDLDFRQWTYYWALAYSVAAP